MWRYRRRYPWHASDEDWQLVGQVRRRRGRWILIGAVLAFVLGAAGGVILWQSRSGDAGLGTAAQPPADQTARAENARGGYAFRHPGTWAVTEDSTKTDVTDPGRHVMVSLDVGPRGTIEAESEPFVGSVTAGWLDVQMEAPYHRILGAGPAVFAGGTGVDGLGRSLRFLTIIVDGGSTNYTISVLVPTTWHPLTLQPAIEQIVSSFRPLGTA